MCSLLSKPLIRTRRLLCLIITAQIIVLCLAMAGCDNINSPGKKMVDASQFFFDPGALELARAIESEDIQKIEAQARQLDINMPHQRGMTFLMWALSREKLASLKTLLALDADIHAEVESISPGEFAMDSSDPRWIAALMEAGLDPNEANETQPLWFHALISYAAPVLDYLLEHGKLDVNARDSVGHTATMMLASRGGEYRQVMKLLEQGAELNPVTRNGISFAYYVQTSKVAPDSPEHPYREKILQMLRESGVKFPVLSPSKKEALTKQREG